MQTTSGKTGNRQSAPKNFARGPEQRSPPGPGPGYCSKSMPVTPCALAWASTLATAW